MSGNPNMEKIGKRKNAPAKKQADWLFPSSDKPASTSVTKSQNQDRSKNKQEKQLAKDLLKQQADGSSSKPAPPSQLVGLIGAFLSENEFASTTRAFRTESGTRGLAAEDVQNIPSLNTIYNEWLLLKVQDTVPDSKANVGENGKVIKKRNVKQAKMEKKKAKVQESSGASDVEMTDAPPTKVSGKRSPSLSSSGLSSASSSSSDSDADDEKEAPTTKAPSPKQKPRGLKRKAVSSSSESSTSGSDSSSDDEAPQVKKVKTKASSPSSSESSESSSGSDSSSDEAKVVNSSPSKSVSSSSDTGSSSDDEDPDTKKVAQASSSSESDSSEGESDSSCNSVAQKTPLPASDSESSSGSDSDSTSSKKAAVNSESSATLSDGAKKSTTSSSDSSSESSSSDSDEEPKSKKVTKTVVTVTERKFSPPLPPDPVIKKPSRKTNVPFSRIPSDVKVDERLASNAYVPYDYAQKAHEDLIVTKGKGFTKEKNKKKRGSYRGGYIDVEGKKGIKFED
ncbi:Nucleolar and coiled-body phosphoprotein 1 [Lachnellula arida]|uniref:Nucleolar and coiled-body phosphoprotein 1 n=1 Tax=Lachnellula arida TaxID=1316785 RepID=A0A8T9BII4_9HELO|nr:Nucleolar and coiled-body phosphoprotein 1 [Lachnellula arida]